jgi:uncharacterized protein (TIGR03437 family)
MNEEVLLNRSKVIRFTAILVAALGATAMHAQTPANITILSGSGQVECVNCTGAAGTPFFFQPIYVRVTDAAGNPVVSTQVNWTINNGGYFAGAPGNTTFTTTTDANGVTFATPYLPQSTGSIGTYYQPATVTAYTNNFVTATMTVTNSFADLSSFPQVRVNYSQPPATAPIGQTLSGNAGSVGSSFIVQVYSQGGGVSGVSVQLVNSDGTSGPSSSVPSAYCQTGPASTGSNQYAVMTDTTGSATCTPVFGPVGGGGFVQVLVGGVPVTPQNGLTQPVAFGQSGAIQINVTKASVGSVTATSGGGQSAASGLTLPQALVATVKDTAGNPLAGQGISWQVSPTNAGSFSNTQFTTGSNGNASTNFTFSSVASGQVTITATSTSNPNAKATFSVTAIPPFTVTGITKVSGDAQSAIQGSAFGSPLVVQVSVNGGTVSGIPVTFAASGPITLTSAASTTTNSSGQAQVTVQANNTGSTSAAAATVTATAGSSTTSFSLTVNPQPPPISAASFVNAADGQRGAISPCSLGAIVSSGLSLQNAVVGLGPLPYSLNGVSIGFNNGDLAPIASILTNASGQTTIMFQVPCDLTAGSVPVTVSTGGAPANLTLTLQPASPGIYQTVMSDGKARAVVVRPDGSFVSLSNPARRGESLVAFTTGLGPVSPAIGTNALPIPGNPGTPSNVTGTVIVGVNNGGVLVNYARLTEDRIGVSEVSFQVPADAPQGNDVVFSIGVLAPGANSVNYSLGSTIPIQ